MTTWCVRKPKYVALTATIYNFDIELADSDRSVYETLALRVARHPSESEEYLLTRLLAYTMEYTDGIVFSSRSVGARRARDFGARPDRKNSVVDRHRHAGRGAPAQGVKGCAARGGVYP